MDLLDNPPEILQEIIAHFVQSTDLAESWKARAVNTVFKSFIDSEVFARQPTSFFTTTRSHREFLKRNMELYLQYRCKIRPTAQDVLPGFVTRVVNIFMQAGKATTDEERNGHIRQVCKLLADPADDRYRIVTRPTTKSHRDYAVGNDMDNSLALAIHMQDKSLIQYLYANGATIWGEEKAFGNLFARLAGTGNVELVRLVLDCAQGDGFEHKRRQREHALKPITNPYGPTIYITGAITDLVLVWYLRVFRQVTPTTAGNIFDYALRNSQASVLKALLNYNANRKNIQKSRRPVGLPLEGSNNRRKTAQLLLVLVEEGILDVDQKFYTRDMLPRHGYTCSELSILDYAIFLKDAGVVRAVLKAGANPDGKQDEWVRLSSPLGKAIQENLPDIVKLLLDAGANPDHGYQHLSPGTQADREIIALLDIAKRARGDRLRGTRP